MNTAAPGNAAALPDNFEQLVAATLDGSLSPADRAHLGELVATNPDARAFYLNYLATHVVLQWSHDSLPALNLPASTEQAVSTGSPHTPPLSAAGVPMYRKGYEPQPFKLRVHHYALAAAALLVACGLAVYLLTATVDPKPDPVDPNQSPPPVATLIQNTGNLRTPHGYPAEGDDYGSGEYTLSSGTAEFMLTNAVNVRLRGETRMVMHNPMNVSLMRGSAEFVCPADARGFTVQMPDGSKVIDLGTAFSIKLQKNGLSILQVTEGAVVVESNEPLGEPVQNVTAGNRVAIVDGRAVPIQALSLSDIVAGGDGFGEHRSVAIDLNGQTVAYREVLIGPAAGADIVVNDNTMLDRVFFPRGDEPARSHPDAAPIQDLGHGTSHGYLTPSVHADGSIYLHATSGLTFDLDAVRRHHNGSPIRLVATVEHFAPKTHRGNMDFAIVADHRVIHRQRLTQGGQSFPIDIAIPDGSRFLAFVATDGGDGLSSDGLIVRDAQLLLTTPVDLRSFNPLTPTPDPNPSRSDIQPDRH